MAQIKKKSTFHHTYIKNHCLKVSRVPCSLKRIEYMMKLCDWFLHNNNQSCHHYHIKKGTENWYEGGLVIVESQGKGLIKGHRVVKFSLYIYKSRWLLWILKASVPYSIFCIDLFDPTISVCIECVLFGCCVFVVCIFKYVLYQTVR